MSFSKYNYGSQSLKVALVWVLTEVGSCHTVGELVLHSELVRTVATCWDEHKPTAQLLLLLEDYKNQFLNQIGSL